MMMSDLIHEHWSDLSASARAHILATRAEREGYVADDGNAEVDYPHATSARRAAQEYVDDGDWGDASSETTWVTVYTWPRYVLAGDVLDVRRDEIDEATHCIAVEPTEPDCAEGSEEHDWEDDGVQGNGGGVIITEECHRCGCVRRTNTWDEHEGTQGLTSVAYLEGECEVDWVSVDEVADTVTPEVLGADADAADVAEFVAELRDRGPSHATAASWESLQEEILGEGKWVSRAAERADAAVEVP